MQTSATDAEAQLTELARRAEADDDVVPWRHGQPVFRFVAVTPRSDRRNFDTLIGAIRAFAAAEMIPDRVPPEAGPFSTPTTACPVDRDRYLCGDSHHPA